MLIYLRWNKEIYNYMHSGVVIHIHYKSILCKKSSFIISNDNSQCSSSGSSLNYFFVIMTKWLIWSETGYEKFLFLICLYNF